ncbi:adenosine deaminase family protein [Dyella choica]|uniref:adenosine deaminase n=1 Tax=Dyella choica TaxID=1927959 RepID=A0A432MCV4_9GAMM|nr:adenosine deaminase [Dyella choica]RUL80086.1 adenosine deaminase [Dyella choica]
MQAYSFLRSAILAAAIACAAQVSAQAIPLQADTAETRTDKAFDAARQQGPLALHAFLAAMPKGGDLHSHLSGAVYAESWIAQAATDDLCVDVATSSLVDKHTAGAPNCGSGRRPAADALSDQHFYDTLVDAFSMRSFVPSNGHSGHDQFFESFGRFQAVTPQQHMGDWLNEVSTRAAAQNEQYLELMATPPFAHARELARTLGWQADFDSMRQQLLEHGLKDDISADEQLLTQALAERKRQQHCDGSRADTACKVQIRFLYQVLRGAAPERVFAQTLLGFELASVDPRWVGINFVMAEDGYLSMRDYRLQMRMLDYLHRLYPKVHISLHAGELAPGLVPSEGLRFHIRQAVEVGHAKRIGHGVDVTYEDRPEELLDEMAAHHVMVEVNLTSNDVILGVHGADHPLPRYLKHDVPVALSTDDEGVSRIDLTHEYVRAAEDFSLGYRTLKQMARNSLTYSFLSGESLWTSKACQGQSPGSDHPASLCRQFLGSSEKASAQWELEHRFNAFEEAH